MRRGGNDTSGEAAQLTSFPPLRRLEGPAFQPAKKEFGFDTRLRKGAAFPHSKRRSRTSCPAGSNVIWTSLR
jgi:hypothetical protein